MPVIRTARTLDRMSGRGTAQLSLSHDLNLLSLPAAWSMTRQTSAAGVRGPGTLSLRPCRPGLLLGWSGWFRAGILPKLGKWRSIIRQPGTPGPAGRILCNTSIRQGPGLLVIWRPWLPAGQLSVRTRSRRHVGELTMADLWFTIWIVIASFGCGILAREWFGDVMACYREAVQKEKSDSP
jgi:hypothetical protein